MDDRDELQALRRMAELEAKASAVPSVPGSEPMPSTVERLKSMGGAVGKGFLTGGPVGAAASGMGEGMRQFGQGLDRAAYNVGGATTDVLAPYVSPEVAGGAGYAANVATQAIPTVLGGMLGKTAQPIVESASKRVMQSALKPGTKDILSGNSERAVKTLFEEGANVSPGGAAKMQATIDALNKQITGKIAGSPATVDKAHAASEVMGTLGKFRKQVNPVSDEQAILNAWKEFSGRYGSKIPIEQAQAIKQGTYAALKGKYGEVGSASTEAQKSLARGLRKGIEEQIPEIAKLNARESALINALTQVERRVGVGANRDLGGLAWLSNNPAAAAAFMAGRSEKFKSILARLLYSSAGPITTGAGATIGGAIGAEQGREP